MNVRIETMRRNSGTEDPQFREVEIGPITLWFSYQACIAFQVGNNPRVCRVNDWGTTTGKHINQLSDRAGRLPGAEFEKRLEADVGRFFFPRDLDPTCPPPVVADWLQDRGLDRAAEIVRQTS